MNASIQGSLNQINKCWRFFEHKGKSLTKAQVIAVLEYGKNKGYKNISEISDDEVDIALEDFQHEESKQLTICKNYNQDFYK